MNEQEWLTCVSPEEMLRGIEYRERKQWLFVCACCRELPDFMESEPDRQSFELAERWVDGEIGNEVEFPHDEIYDIRWYRRDVRNATFRALESYFDVIRQVYNEAGQDADSLRQAMSDENYYLAELIRDIFGNPFRPITLDPPWLTPDASALTRGMYDSRDFGAMPILADALQDAGCENEEVLNHCRDANQVHVRGCWVVDLLLKKE